MPRVTGSAATGSAATDSAATDSAATGSAATGSAATAAGLPAAGAGGALGEVSAVNTARGAACCSCAPPSATPPPATPPPATPPSATWLPAGTPPARSAPRDMWCIGIGPQPFSGRTGRRGRDDCCVVLTRHVEDIGVAGRVRRAGVGHRLGRRVVTCALGHARHPARGVGQYPRHGLVIGLRRLLLGAGRRGRRRRGHRSGCAPRARLRPPHGPGPGPCR